LGQRQHVTGQYNFVSPIQSAFIVGNGIDDSNRNNLIYAAENAVEITGSLNILGNQTISGSTTINGPVFLEQGFILGSGSIPLTILSQEYSILGTADENNYQSDLFLGDASIFIATKNNYPISNRPGAQIQIKSGSNVSAWYYDADGTSYFPSDVNIGFDAPLSEYLTSGSLNIRNGNINLSGSLNVSGSIISLDKVDAPNINLKGGNISFDANGAGILHTGQFNITTVFEDNELANTWTFNQYGTLTTPGDIVITGSLNVSGSVNIDNIIKLTPVTNFPTGQAGMLVASASYGFTNFYMYDGSDWKWLVTGSIA
jgi:hypothetical protein